MHTRRSPRVGGREERQSVARNQPCLVDEEAQELAAAEKTFFTGATLAAGERKMQVRAPGDESEYYNEPVSPLTTCRLTDVIDREERIRGERSQKVEAQVALLERTENHRSRKRIETSIEETRSGTRDLFQRRNEMEQTAYETREARIADFNERRRTAADSDPWDTHFQDIVDLEERQRPAAWKRVPSSPFKRFQECFVYPEDYVLPRKHDEDPGLLRDGLIVNPECVPDDLAQKLGFVTFEEDDMPVDRWQKKHAPEGVAALHSLLGAAKPLRAGNMRLMVLPDGRILYSSENGQGGGSGRKPALKAGVYDVYGAYRKTFHERELYGQETVTLERVKRRLAELGDMIATWTSQMPDAEKLQIEEQAIPVIDECADELQACIDVYKRVAGDTLDGIEDFTVTRRKDGRRIRNPSAVMAKLVKTRDALEGRFGEMVPKGRYNQEDSMVLHREIERSEQVFTGLRGKLAGATAGTIQDLSKDHHFNGLKGIRVEPLKTYAEKILAIKEAELDPKKTGSPGECIDPMVKMYVITKFQEVARCFEQMKVRMLSLEHLKVFEYKQLVDELAGLFTAIDIFPDHRIDAYVAPYEQMCRDLQEIQRGLTHYECKALSIDQRKELFERFRSYLDRFDIRQIIAELP